MWLSVVVEVLEEREPRKESLAFRQDFLEDVLLEVILKDLDLCVCAHVHVHTGVLSVN